VDVQGSTRHSISFNVAPNWTWYQYACITSSRVSDESKLCCGREIGFGQAVSYEIHRSNERGNLAFSHYGGTKKEQEASNLRGFPKIACFHKNDPYLLPFMEEVLDMVARHEVYLFLYGFLGYHHITITLEDMYKTAFITDSGMFVWIVMPFGLKNVPPTYQWTMSTTFREYLGMFMKLFMDDFSVFNDLKMHLAKFCLCFDKCWKFSISLNIEKCIFWSI